MMVDIALDRETMRALAAPTRAAMLRLLEQRRHTQTELAQALGIAVPTAKQHVEALQQAGLVEVHEEGRKWKYCGLTRKARNLLNPEERRITLMLVLTGLSAAGAVLALSRGLFLGTMTKMAAAPALETALGEAPARAAPPIAASTGGELLATMLTLAAVFGLLAFHFWRRNREARRKILER